MKTNAGALMSQVQRMGARIFERIVRDSGIDAFTGAQGKILYVLWEHGEMTISGIARETSLTKSTLTGMLDVLEEKQLIQRIPDTKNRRQIFIRITEKTREYKKDYDGITEEMTELTYAGFSEAELRSLEDMLKRIKRNLEDYAQRMEGSHE